MILYHHILAGLILMAPPLLVQVSCPVRPKVHRWRSLDAQSPRENNEVACRSWHSSYDVQTEAQKVSN